jgi:hypothetical protein
VNKTVDGAQWQYALTWMTAPQQQG